jgi:SAM-dependent methyltransferase
VFGVDASESLAERARSRVPEAQIKVGEMEALPFEADSFDLVTGFNSFFFATDIAAALREAGRVAKPGAAVVIQVWGRHEHCELEAMKEIVRPFMPPRPVDAPAEPDYWRPGVLEELAAGVGLEPETAFDISWAYEYADDDALGRQMVAPAGIAALVGDREDEVRQRIVDALESKRTPDGYRLSNEFHYLIARAP